MNTTEQLPTRTNGQRMVNAERLVLLSKMLDILCEGYVSTNALSKKLRVSRPTIEMYRPVVDQMIAKTKIDRNVIRNLQLKRTYLIIEQLMEDLRASKEVKDRTMIYNQIYKFSSHLALITGLNVETHVNVDPSKLVIIRSGKSKRDFIEQAPGSNELPNLIESS